jgi:hypothetical protein
LSDFDADDALRHRVATEREGLPSGYRMRADAHYVDQLTGRSPDVPMRLVAVEDIDEPEATASIASGDLRPLVQSIKDHGVLQPLLVLKAGVRYRLIAGRNRLAAARAAQLARVPCLVHQVDDEKAQSLARATQVKGDVLRVPAVAGPRRSHGQGDTVARVAESVSGIRSAAAMAAGAVTPMARRVALDLVRAEAWRASWQLAASEILDDLHEWRFRPLHLGSLVRQASDGFASECRLRSVGLRLTLVDGDASAEFDEDAIICAVTGAVVATADLVGGGDAPEVAVTLRRWNSDALAVEIAQDVVSPPPIVAERFFDSAWLERPGGWTATMGATVAQIVAERHGGEAVFLADGHGSTVRLVLKPARLSTRRS